MDYPLLCSFCGKTHTLAEKMTYSLEITETLLNTENNSETPHKQGNFRHMQICEDCLSNGVIGAALANEKRQF